MPAIDVGDIVYCNDGRGTLVRVHQDQAWVDLDNGGTWRGRYEDVHLPGLNHDGTINKGSD